MKIIEGTPEEIKEYLKKEETKNKIYWSDNFANVAKKEVNHPFRTFNSKELAIDALKGQVHWSNSKHSWLSIKGMDSIYIVNVLRKKLNENKAIDLIEDTEFKSLILNLSGKIEEEL